MVSLLLFSCKKDKSPLELPTVYVSADFTSNTSDETGLRSKLAALTATAKTGVASTLTYAQLTDLYTAGTPSLLRLKSITR